MSISWLIPLVVVLSLFGLTRALLFLVQVEGWSMYPTFHHGERVVALRFWPRRWLHRGQIVVWQIPSERQPLSMPKSMGGKLYIKRLVGLPGDVVTADISTWPEPLRAMLKSAYDDQGRRIWHVPTGHCFVKGDSPGLDSRTVGPIPFHALRGLVIVRLPRRKTIPDRDFPIDLPPSYPLSQKTL